MEVSLNYCSQNGGNLYRAPYYNRNLNIGPRIDSLDYSSYAESRPDGVEISCQVREPACSKLKGHNSRVVIIVVIMVILPIVIIVIIPIRIVMIVIIVVIIYSSCFPAATHPSSTNDLGFCSLKRVGHAPSDVSYQAGGKRNQMPIQHPLYLTYSPTTHPPLPSAPPPGPHLYEGY